MCGPFAQVNITLGVFMLICWYVSEHINNCDNTGIICSSPSSQLDLKKMQRRQCHGLA